MLPAVIRVDSHVDLYLPARARDSCEHVYSVSRHLRKHFESGLPLC